MDLADNSIRDQMGDTRQDRQTRQTDEDKMDRQTRLDEL